MHVCVYRGATLNQSVNSPIFQEIMVSAERIQVKARTKLLLNGIGAVVAGFMVALIWGHSLDNYFSDLLFRIRGPLPAPDSVVIVGIDDESFANLRLQWPWPRRVHARLINSISSARVIVFDILFDTPDNGGGDDLLFAKAIGNHSRVILSTARITREDKISIKESWLDPVSPLRNAAEHIATIELPVDNDSVVRRARREFNGRSSLAYLAAKEYAGGDIEPPHDEIVINFMGPAGSVTTVSYQDVLDRPTNTVSDPFKDKLVFVGTTSEIGNNPNLPDRFRTPFSRAGATTPGVEIHATAAINLLSNTTVRHLSPLIAWPLGVSLAVLCGLVFSRSGVARSVLVCVLLVSVLWLTAYVLFSGLALYIQMAAMTIPLIAVFLVSLMTHYYETLQSERQSRLLLAESEKRINEIIASQPDQADESAARPIKVFLSYSHKSPDAEFMVEILEFLKGLQSDGIEFWSDMRIVEGELWDQEIKRRLADSDMAVTLISQSYLDSDYCGKEVKAFLERKIVVLPVILSPCEWKRYAWLSARQFIPAGEKTIVEHYESAGERQRIYLDIRKALRAHAENLRHQVAKPSSLA